MIPSFAPRSLGILRVVGARAHAVTSSLAAASFVVFLLSSLFAMLGAACRPAQAHFYVTESIRIIHVQHETAGLRLLIRQPTSHLLQPRLSDGPVEVRKKNDNPSDKPTQLGPTAPFTFQFESDDPDFPILYFIDPAALRKDPEGIGLFVEEDIAVVVNGERIRGEVQRVVVQLADRPPEFSTLTQASDALGGAIYPPGAEAEYVSGTLLDVEIFYPTDKETRTFSLESLSEYEEDRNDATQNFILDYWGGEPQVHQELGSKFGPLTLQSSLTEAMLTFLILGIEHLLLGLDHILFVVCLALSAITVGGLVGRVTGFTVGHSVMLSVGFLGYTPAVFWFLPVIEILIALSILWAAASALFRSPIGGLWVTTAIGFIHGMGFASVLEEFLPRSAVDVWPSLGAFNVGVEIGQIIIILPVFIGFAWLFRIWPEVHRILRAALLFVAIATSVFWTVDRVRLLFI